MRTVYLETSADMQWLADVHTGGKVFGAAILYGNEDCPERIECWHEIAPSYTSQPDAVFTLREDGTYLREEA